MSREIRQKEKYTYSVKELAYSELPMDKQFTYIIPYWNKVRDKDINPILGHYSLTELIEHLNTMEPIPKGEGKAFVKGLMKGGISGSNIYKTSKYLFFDIDVKNTKDTKENEHLHPSTSNGRVKNAQVFQWLYERAVFIGRSASGNGMFGALLVEGLEKFDHTTSKRHKLMAEEVFKYLSDQIFKELGIPLKFDPQQAKFRQNRWEVRQTDPIEINRHYVTYDVKETIELVTIGNNIPDFEYSNSQGVAKGSIREKYNSSTNIEDLLVQAGFSHVSGNRWKYYASSSATSGEVIDNVYINNSSTFSSFTRFDPLLMLCKIKGFNTSQVYDYLRKKGYEDDEVKPTKAIPKDATHEQLWELCQPAKHLSSDKRLEFIEAMNPTEEQMEVLKKYMRIKNLKIRYDRTLKIKKWVSEEIEEALNIADSKKKVLIVAETGTGKTTAIIDGVLKYRAGKRVLIIAPLTVIVESIEAYEQSHINDKIVRLSGTVSPQDYFRAKRAEVVIATPHHATTILDDFKIGFDYIARDEIHSDILGMSYRHTEISRLNQTLKKIKVPNIGLTGTPLNSFHRLGFEVIKFDNQSKPDKVIQRTDNRTPEKIILQHQRGVKGRAIYRANSKSALEKVKNYLINRLNHDPESIVILSSDEKHKLSEQFKKLVNKQIFDPRVNIVLTTSVIDEGVSIKDVGFSDVVYIDNSYYPRPEYLKQFINRFRLKSADMSYYHYRKSPKAQFYRDSIDDYDRDIELLSAEGNDEETLDVLSPISDKKYRYEDGTPNINYILYQEATHFTNSFNNREFNEYVETNFNIELIIDHDYQEEEVDVKRGRNTENYIKMAQLFLENDEEVQGALASLTLDKSLLSILDSRRTPSQEVYDFVQAHKAHFEKLYKAHEVFKEYTDEPTKLLFKNDDQVETTQVLNRKISYYETHKAIHFLEGARAERARKRMQKFFKKLQPEMTIFEVEQLWGKVGHHVDATTSKYFYKDLIAGHTPFVFDRTKNVIVEKATHPSVAESAVPDWIKSFDPHHEYKKTKKEVEIEYLPEVKQYKIEFDV